MVKEHPDYQEEEQRLSETKQYIEEILTAAEGKHENFKGNIKEAFENLDYLDSSLSYINILVNAKFIEMNSADIVNPNLFTINDSKGVCLWQNYN